MALVQLDKFKPRMRQENNKAQISITLLIEQ